MNDNDTLTLNQLVRSARKNPSYWMQVALLEFLQSLAAMRTSKGIRSNKALAKLIGVSPPTVSRWLNGSENITISTMCRLAAALGAAVHIHVADQDERGRWRPEVGIARAERSESVNIAAPASTSTGSVKYVGDFSKYRARRESLAAKSVEMEQPVNVLVSRAK